MDPARPSPICRSTVCGAFVCCLIAASAHAESLTITTFAGQIGNGGAPTDGSGDKARFYGPFSTAVDNNGSVYVADMLNHTVRKISQAGVVTTLAGLAGNPGFTDGEGSAARFNRPSGVAVHSGGAVFVTDWGNNAIRKVTPGGVVSTLASGSFNLPEGLCVDGDSNVYVSDTRNDRICKVTPAGVVSTLAGLAGSAGNADGAGSAARFNLHRFLTVDGAGNVYVGDLVNCRIRKITPEGVVSTLPYTIPWFPSGPGGVAIDSSGNLYATPCGGVSSAIFRITLAGALSTLAGGYTQGWADGTGSAAQFWDAEGFAVDRSRNLYVADYGNDAIRKVTPGGVVTTLAGKAPRWGSIDGTGTEARFNCPYGVAVDGSGNLYVTEANGVCIRKITPGGVVSTLAGLAGMGGSTDGTGSAARFSGPGGVAVDSSGNVWVVDSGNQTIRRITPAGVVSTLAGLAGQSGSADGTGNAARFHLPCGIAWDGGGNAYVTDTRSHTIRKVTPAGVVTTLAGLAGTSGTADGTGSAARFYYPSGIAVGADGSIYVTDGMNTLRKITQAGDVSTLAGSPDSHPVHQDGTGSGARFAGISGVAVDGNGNLLVSEAGNPNGHTIRKVTQAGVVTTLAGQNNVEGYVDGTGSGAEFYGPRFLATGSGGKLYICDWDAIRLGTAPAPAIVATIDQANGNVGSTRQLDATLQTGTSNATNGTLVNSGRILDSSGATYQWTFVRQPSATAAYLSSTTVRNPVFTPDVPDTYTFQLTATDANGNVTTSMVDLNATVDQNVTPPVITSSTAATGAIDTQFSYQITAINNPTSFHATDLPSWAVVDTTTGAITGTPDAAGLTNMTIYATNAGGADSVTVALTVNLESQTITFGALPAKTVGAQDFDPGATASSGLPVSYASSNLAVATIVNGRVHVAGPGTTTITASQAGDANWNPAHDVQQTLTVDPVLILQVYVGVTIRGQVHIAWGAGTTGRNPGDATPEDWVVIGGLGGETHWSNVPPNDVTMNVENTYPLQNSGSAAGFGIDSGG